MRRPELQTLERLRHWQGEQLQRSDLMDQRAYDARRAGWHNRSLHESFGAVEGLEVAREPDSALVAPGLGYDALGNPVWLDHAVHLPLPSGLEPQYLVLGVPGARSAHGLAWVPESEFLAEDGLPLAAYSDGTLEPCQPRRIRALRRPVIHTAETVRGRTPWEIWEVSAPGEAAKIQAGVQTRIDASAAGFTRTPHYFASLEAPVWSASAALRPDFAPTYLAHVANPTPEGFTFRLLLKDIALRRVGVLEVTAQISRIVDASFDRMSVELETAQPFLSGDAIVLVRPRATRACTIHESAAELITLDAPLPLPSGTRVALGNLPRLAQVIAFEPTTRTRLLIDEGPVPERGAVLAFQSAGGAATAAARVASASGSELLLDRLWTPPAAGAELRTWPAGSTPVVVEKVETNKTKLQVATSNIEKDDWVVALSPVTSALSRPVLVTAASKSKITLAESIEGLAAGSRLLVLRQPVQASVSGVTSDAGIATLNDPAPFLAGDLVAAQGRGGAPGIVLGIEGDRVTIQHGTDFTLATGDVLVGANWERATTVLASFSAAGPVQVLKIADTGVLRPQDLLYAWRAGSTTPTAPVAPELNRLNVVTLIPAPELLLASRAELLARGDVLLAARFPCVTPLVAVENERQLRFASPGFAVGDWIAPLGSTGEFRLVQLAEQLAPNLFLTSASVDPALAGASFGVVHFGSIGTVSAAQADDPENSLRLERPTSVRAAGDFVGPWTHFFDAAPFSIVDQVIGKRLVLRAGASSRFAGDGVVPNGLIDGGVLALASLSPDQRRLAVEQALALGDEITASGPGPLGDEQALPMSVSQSDAATARVVLDPRVGVASYSLRPERLNLLSVFNERFPELFALFAQKQGLYVAWTACEDFEASPLAEEPPRGDPCHDIEEDPCPCQA